METKQTAVEWLVSQIAGTPTNYIIDGELTEIKENRYNLLFNLDIDITPLVEQAKAMEKEQIKDAYNQADLDSYFNKTYEGYAEKYYNETYEN